MKKIAAPLGILGDGQLALMLGEAALAQGVEFLGFGQDQESSFARAFPGRYIYSAQIDTDSLTAFAGRCSTLTLENEFFSADLLEEVQTKSGTPIIPSPKNYRYFENKISQRKFYEFLSIPGPRWAVAEERTDQILTQLKSSFHYPVVLKASQGGYDGYGVRMLDRPEDLASALLDLKHSSTRPVLIEEKVSLSCELAQGALFDGKGNAVLLPLVETVQRNGICELVLSRPRLPKATLDRVKKEIEAVLNKLAKSGIDGLYSFEFFLTQDGLVLINEGAPRPHNSQHLSINASSISQFDLLVSYAHHHRLPEVQSPVFSKPGVMLNLLGKSSGPDYQLSLPALAGELQVYSKLYQKKECRVGRKMGHLNLVDPAGKLDLVQIGERVLKEYQL